ncbi:SDR family NAD(P)-dependent oxidoreductase [Nocardia sp. CA-135953]|uniref:SDR family NAD(P)-dependent oxidoreductase n=1 Tax=Nocardia sp. CA-135953 TaxID=3239978 RepID=UPI003D99F64E
MVKTVIVTGSSGGSGAISLGFVARGDNVVLNGRDADKLAAVADSLGAPSQLAVFAGDIGTPTTGSELVRLAVERFRRVDVLVNNAGIVGVSRYNHPVIGQERSSGRTPNRTGSTGKPLGAGAIRECR